MKKQPNFRFTESHQVKNRSSGKPLFGWGDFDQICHICLACTAARRERNNRMLLRSQGGGEKAKQGDTESVRKIERKNRDDLTTRRMFIKNKQIKKTSRGFNIRYESIHENTFHGEKEKYLLQYESILDTLRAQLP